jgi:superfamily II DNA or RNA helicase
MNREEKIRHAFGLVVSTMELRQPQVEALKALRDELLKLPKPLRECQSHVVRQFMTRKDGSPHPAHPSYTLSLATGVGKTRLAGAIMALLWLTNEARTFLVLAPRRAVLQRFENALNPRFREYIFVNSGLVPEPHVIRADEIESPSAFEHAPSLFQTGTPGPRIFLLSQQLITTSDRFKERRPHASKSAAEALREAQDLVAIVDEAHHVGGYEGNPSKWADAIKDLEPKLQVGLTATHRRDDPAVLYEYSLPRAVDEGHYTKQPTLLVRKYKEAIAEGDTSAATNDQVDDLDRAALLYGLDRLAAKADAVAVCDVHPFPKVKPILVVFATNTEHANNVYEWLLSLGRFEADEILKTDSATAKTEKTTELLLGVETYDNPVRVIVNVQELMEGWDVSNVYVVVPLRALATFTSAVQAMGRGLRLPAGRRVGVPEVDSLDVVLFGRDDATVILKKSIAWSGKDGGQESSPGISVLPYDTPSTQTVTLPSSTVRRPSVSFRELQLVDEELPLDVDAAALAGLTRAVIDSLDLSQASLNVGQGFARLPKQRFVTAAAVRTSRELSRYLSDEQHMPRLCEVIQSWIDQQAYDGDLVPYDPSEVAVELSRILRRRIRSRSAAYEETGDDSNLVFPGFSIQLQVPPGQFTKPELQLSDVQAYSIDCTFRQRYPYKGWRRGCHEAYTFDTSPEAKVAWLIDSHAGVQWWVRNQPRRFHVPTPLGNYHPDFLVYLDQFRGLSPVLLLVEVKMDLLWESEDGESRLKASAAREWCRVQSAVGTKSTVPLTWVQETALESMIDASPTWAALEERLIAAARSSTLPEAAEGR